jgi:hypothetical protein
MHLFINCYRLYIIVYHKLTFPQTYGCAGRKPSRPRLSAGLLLEPEPIVVKCASADDAVGRTGGAPPGGDRTPRPKFSFRQVVSNFNPKKVFWDRPREDLKAFSEARKAGCDEMDSEPAVVKARVDLKFMGALAISEMAGTCIGAPLVGVVFQEVFKSAYMGVVGTVVGDYLPAVFGFQVAWAALNADFYKSRAKSLIGRIKEFYKDVIPIHLSAAAAAIPSYAVGSAVSGGLIAAVNSMGSHIAEKIKLMPFLSELINFGVTETMYLALLGGAAMTFMDRFTTRYLGYLGGKAGASREGSETN